ncbi:MAG: hypothetical protein KatS3mg110_0218 [Pirellulaceae bacterium]|nr:MAG: hypothetical protein KatS3mg110_0218 [Pirellulaceae bacterium]
MRRSSARIVRQVTGLLKHRSSRPTKRFLRLEWLEPRQLLAGDFESPVWWSGDGESRSTGAESEWGAEVASRAEAEPARDLVAFAKALSAAGVKFFGADWCPFCNQQKALFEDGARFLPFIEVTNPDRTLNDVGVANNITAFPTWEFPDGSRATGVLSLDELSQRSGVPIPTGESPSFAPIPDITLFAGSPLQLAIDAYDPNGGPLTITAQSDNPSVVQVSVSQNNPSVRMTVAGFGDMVFQLFQDKVPRVVDRFLQLVQMGFYDAANNDPPIAFHRVIPDFVIQAGDPTGTGSGGSPLGPFDDQFHLDLQHNQAGVLSYAKAGDDTNDSQFFITAAPQRHLDFNHSVFGQLVEGDSVRAAINRTATDDQDRPLRDITIESISVFQDVENGIVQLKAPHGVTGTANITVTVTDAEGNSFSQTFRVTVVADPFNSAPFLEDIPPLQTVMNQPLTFQLRAQDVEQDSFFFDAVKQGEVDFQLEVDHATGLVTVTPPLGFVGALQLLVGVRGATLADTVDQFDTQRVSIPVVPPAPSGIKLQPESDTGASSTDGITNAQTIRIEVSDVLANTDVLLFDGDRLAARGRSSSNRMVFMFTGGESTTASEGTHVFTAMHEVNGVRSAATAPFTVVIDRTPPDFQSTPETLARFAIPYQYNVQTDDEASGDVHYQLVTAPQGMAIDPLTGIISWTAQPAQRGDHTVVVRATDVAGNSAEQEFTVTVQGDELLQVRVEITRPSGVPASAFEVGETLVAHVWLRDLRSVPEGIRSAFIDLLFPPDLVSLAGDVTFGPAFGNGTFQTATGELDEIGGEVGTEHQNDEELLLFSAPFRADRAGTVIFTPDPADQLPEHEIFLAGRDEPVPANLVIFTPATLQIFLPFVAQNDLFNVDEDSVATPDVLANDFFVGTSTGPLRVRSLGTPSAGGSVSLTEDGQVRYQPAPDFFGIETFTYEVTDDVTGTATATVTVQVHPVNDPPTARDDQFTGSRAIPEDSPAVLLDVLANDSSEPDQDEVLRIVSVGTTSHGGTVTIAPAGPHLMYKPAPNFFGIETFTYTISDGNGGTATATVTVEVTEVNDPPVAVNDIFTLPEDSPFTRFDPLANDHSGPDPAEDLRVVAVGRTATSRGTVRIIEDGKAIEYQPPPDFFGNDTFTYTISDGRGGTAVAQIRFTVTPVNDPPRAVDDTGEARFRVTKNSSDNVLDVLRNDTSDPDVDEVLAVQSVGPGSAGGTIRVGPELRNVLYSPPPGFVGIETFTYTIVDPGGLTSTATVEVEVLDFLPSSISGAVYVDANDNGVFDPGELPLGGVRIVLTGTDLNGTPVQRTEITGTDGTYQFLNLAPGTYTVTQEQPPFFADGRDTIGTQGGIVENDRFIITLDQNVTGTGNNFGERGRLPRYISIHERFASRRRHSLLVLVDTANGSSSVLHTNGVPPPKSLQAQLNGDRWNLVLSYDGQPSLTANLPNRPTRYLQPLGRAGDMVLLRLSNVSAGSVFQQVASSGSSPAEGEPLTGSVRLGGVAGGPERMVGEGEAVLRGTQSSVTKNGDVGSSFPEAAYNSYKRTVDELLAQPDYRAVDRPIDVSWLWDSRRARR